MEHQTVSGLVNSGFEEGGGSSTTLIGTSLLFRSKARQMSKESRQTNLYRVGGFTLES
jgi:hypothetical protein